jgi:hypothetical protein
MTMSIPVFGNKCLGQNTSLTLFLIHVLQFQCFSDTTAQIGPKQPHCSCSEITHRHTAPVGLLRTSDQLVAEAAIYTTHNKHKRRTATSSVGFEPAVLRIKRPQTYALHWSLIRRIFDLVTSCSKPTT